MAPASSRDKAVLFLGVGQDTRTAEWIKQRTPWLAEVIEPINYLAYPNPDSALEVAVQHAKNYIDGENNDVIIAESQAVPLIVMMLQKKIIPYPEKLILVGPLGCNYAQLGSTPIMRYKTLLNRSKLFWRHPNQTLKIWGNRRTFLNIISASLPHFRRIKPMYMWGANQNCVDDLASLSKFIEIHIVVATDDSLFPFKEIAETMRGLQTITLHEVPGTHLNRATELGIDVLEYIHAKLIE